MFRVGDTSLRGKKRGRPVYAEMIFAEAHFFLGSVPLQ